MMHHRSDIIGTTHIHQKVYLRDFMRQSNNVLQKNGRCYRVSDTRIMSNRFI